MRTAIVLLAILALAANLCAAEFSFVQISDLHMKDQACAEYLAKAVEWLNDPETFGNQKPSFVVVTGDLATDGLEAELALCKTELDKLSLPYYVLPGNHDLHQGKLGNFEKVFPDRTRYFADLNGVRFLFDIGEVDETLPAWVKSVISTSPEDALVIFLTHYPYGKGVRYRVPGREKVLDALKQRRLLAVISGHFHGDTTVVEDGVLFKTIPCLANSRGNHDGTAAKGAYLYTVDGDSISAKFLRISS